MAGASPALCFVVCTSSDHSRATAKQATALAILACSFLLSLLLAPLLCQSHRHSVFEYHLRIPQYRQAYKYRLKYGGYMCCALIGGTLVLI